MSHKIEIMKQESLHVQTSFLGQESNL